MMSADAVCRVCLVNNLNLYGVRNDLQNVYKEITREKFNEAGYPVRMCYICLSALRKCHRFMETARDANSALKQFYNQQCQMAVVPKPLSTYSVIKQELVSIECGSIPSELEVKIEKSDLEEQSDDGLQPDCYTLCEEIEIEVKPEIKTNDEIQLSHANEISKELNIETKIEETHERDPDIFVFERKCKPQTEIAKSKRIKKEKTHICDVCNKYYISACGLKRHIKSKHPTEAQKKYPKTRTPGVKQFFCNICNFKASAKGHLTVHLKRHSGDKPFKCDQCNFKSIHQSDLTNHMRKHTGEKPFSCNICSFKSSWRRHLISHIKTHTGEKPYLCTICGYKCALKEYLYRHMKVHGGKMFCDHCSYKTILKTKLIKHMRTHHGEKTFKCTSCSFASGLKKDLRSHMKVHREDKPFLCNICSYSTFKRSTLKRHMRSHTGEKPYPCNFCDFKCTQKASLNLHVLRKHTGDMPLSCNLCPYKCATNTELIIHVRSHTGEKPFACHVCNYKSSQKTNLMHHMKIHTGVKPFSCNICSYRCIQKSTLKVHMKRHLGTSSMSSTETGINTADCAARAQFTPSEQRDSN